jgi:o-succinylbenzoate synthase
MNSNLNYRYHSLQFKRPSGTSRGILRTKDSWYIRDVTNNGIGEISIIEGLSIESKEMVQQWLGSNQLKNALSENWSERYPAVQFAIDTLVLSSHSNDRFHLFDSPFYNQGAGIPINGLIWMGKKEYMFDQIIEKLKEGYTCLKLKIGAIDFEEEISLLQYVRTHFSPADIELRVDANGAFSSHDALDRLDRLSKFHIHSIEQPIKAGQWESMAELCAVTPLPIALDEELIGINSDRKKVLLEMIKPQYIILKPSLIGGFTSSDEWIQIAESMNIAWWATSALESNVGLNAIAQWVAAKGIVMPQGLGTGQLYSNNIDSPLVIRDGSLYYDQTLSWDLSVIDLK